MPVPNEHGQGVAVGTDDRVDSNQRRSDMFNRLAKIALAFGVLATVGLTMLPLEAHAGGRCYRGTGGVWTCY